MRDRTNWLQAIVGLLQLLTGATIVGVEAEIIRLEEPGTPGAFSLLHKEVALKGLCQLVSGVVVWIQLCRKNTLTILLALVMCSMNSLTLAFLIWQCGYGISSINEQCDMYPESCVKGTMAAYSRSLLETQESMFAIGTASCLLAIFLLIQRIKRSIAELELNLKTLQNQFIQRDNQYDNVALYSK
ncbi:uncharacterized protein [Watersipora subatra]|uniref:uncharacterized protein n=1 Tax=Watersipora subatra TaxID=2589382 RepID=UPI00355B9D0E